MAIGVRKKTKPSKDIEELASHLSPSSQSLQDAISALDNVMKEAKTGKYEEIAIEFNAEKVREVFYTTRDGTRIKIFDVDIAKRLESGSGVIITKHGKQDDDDGVI